MTENRAERSVVILEKDWIFDKGIVTVRHNGEKMLLNDTLTMIWMEIDGSSDTEAIIYKIYTALGGDEPMDSVAAVVRQGIEMLEAEGLIAFASQDDDDWFRGESYA